MKKLIFRIAVLTATFFIGSGIFVFVFLPLNPIPEIPAPESLPAPAKYEKYDCLETSFPGLSKKSPKSKEGKALISLDGFWETTCRPNILSPVGTVSI